MQRAPSPSVKVLSLGGRGIEEARENTGGRGFSYIARLVAVLQRPWAICDTSKVSFRDRCTAGGCKARSARHG